MAYDLDRKGNSRKHVSITTKTIQGKIYLVMEHETAWFTVTKFTEERSLTSPL